MVVKRTKPRLPAEAREKIHKGGTHKDKRRKGDRQKSKRQLRRDYG